MTKVEWYAIGKPTTLESNKSLNSFDRKTTPMHGR
jgi:hypothetical protein